MRLFSTWAWIAVSGLAMAADPPVGWTQWGGPTADFRVPTKGLAETWPEFGPKVVWHRKLGDGYAAILAQGERLFTLYRSGDDEVAVCLEAKTGKTVWEHKAKAGEFWPDTDKSFGPGPVGIRLLRRLSPFRLPVRGWNRLQRRSSGRFSPATVTPTKAISSGGQSIEKSGPRGLP